jgi:hypothetical protein
VGPRIGERALASKAVLEKTDADDWFSRLSDPETDDRRFLDTRFGYVQPARVAETVADAATLTGRRT